LLGNAVVDQVRDLMRRDLDVVGALRADFLDLGAEEAQAVLALDAALIDSGTDLSWRSA
jgi:hypothetical protein